MPYKLVGDVKQGGAVGPGTVEMLVGYARWQRVPWTHDCRSGTKASGSCVWLLPDGVYRLTGFADGNRGIQPDNVLHVRDEEADRLSSDAVVRLMIETWPQQAERAKATKAEAERRRQEEDAKREAERAEQEARAEQRMAANMAETVQTFEALRGTCSIQALDSGPMVLVVPSPRTSDGRRIADRVAFARIVVHDARGSRTPEARSRNGFEYVLIRPLPVGTIIEAQPGMIDPPPGRGVKSGAPVEWFARVDDDRLVERLDEKEAKRLKTKVTAPAREKAKTDPAALPKLSGSARQVAWAKNLRSAFARSHPTDGRLKTERSAKFWIENRQTLGVG